MNGQERDVHAHYSAQTYHRRNWQERQKNRSKNQETPLD